MANKSNAELWVDIKECRKDKAQLEAENARLMAELDNLQAEIDLTAIHTEVLEAELKRVKKELGESISDRKLRAEKKIAYNRGFQEGRGKQ
jgi:chromosome segregation ATPase